MLILVENNLNKAINLLEIIQLFMSVEKCFLDFVLEIQSIQATAHLLLTF